jgi:K+-sensing histidine kinase KdpD
MSLNDIITTKNPARNGLAIWAAGWMFMLIFEHTLELETLCTIAVLVAVLGATTLDFISTFVLATLTTLAINWIFVPPQGSFLIDLRDHAILLIAQWTISITVTGLMVMQRHYSAWLNTNLQRLTTIENELKDLLNHSQDLTVHSLEKFLSVVADDSVSLQLTIEENETGSLQAEHYYIGTPSFEVKIVMSIVGLQGHAFGPLTGNNENLGSWYFPIKRDGKLIGVVHIPLKNHEHDLLLEKKFAAVKRAIEYFDRFGIHDCVDS